jgi:ABC-type multidrug transport system ATPase subunit
MPEIETALKQLVRRRLPVVPVLLPGAPAQPELPLLLRGSTSVDLRAGFELAAVDWLVWEITGLLHWRDLAVKVRGGREILSLPNGGIREGNILFLRGDSGSGKTTFIRLCLGILPPNLEVKGSLTYRHRSSKDQVIFTIPLIEKGKVYWRRVRRLAGLFFSYCPQNPFARFDTRRTLRRQVAEASMLDWWAGAPELMSVGYTGLPAMQAYLSIFHGCLGSRDQIDQELVERTFGSWLKTANLRAHDLDGLAYQRSYGFVQRLSMGQLPATQSILFLDEPFNGVDLVTRNQMVDSCIDFLETERVRSIVCSTHDEAVVQRFKERLRGGRLKVLDLSGKRQDDRQQVPPPPLRSLSMTYVPQPELVVERRSKGRHLRVIVPKPATTLFGGRLVGIAGPSNCGKTSLGRHLCGWEGKGEGLSDKKQFVPQNPFMSFSPGLPVIQSFTDRTAFRYVAKDTELPDELEPLLEMPPSALSGGQLQRLRILGAIAKRPELLFLDEPFAHQDQAWTGALSRSVLKFLDKNPKSRVFLVSHDVNLLASLCDRLLILAEFYLLDRRAEVYTLPVVNVGLEKGRPIAYRTLSDAIRSQLTKGKVRAAIDSVLEANSPQKNDAVKRAHGYLEDLADALG